MPTLSYSAALMLCAGALAAGLLASWAWFHLHVGTNYVSADAHRAELLALRQRYRRRLRAMRDSMLRYKLGEDELKSRLRVAADHQAVQDKLLAAAQAEVTSLHDRVTAQHAAMDQQATELTHSNTRSRELASELQAAQERIAGFQQDHGLLRIERDELVARTQRLRALQAPDAANPGTASPVPATGVSRAQLADRNARIHELECQLRESESRMTELQSSLNTWKYRIAPLTLHMKMQRDKSRQRQEASRLAKRPDAPADNLQRIRGIGRALEKKLRAGGVNRFVELAALSPAELANLAVQIGVAASRPQRERWAEQARELTADMPPEMASTEQRIELV